MYNKRSGATYKLRAAIKEELGTIAKLCDDAAYLANENIDWDKIEPFLNYLFETKQFIQVLEHDGELVGVLIGMKTEHPYFDIKPMAHELVWYVKEEHRGNKKSVLMLRDFMLWAKQNECNRIVMTSFFGDFHDTCNKIFLKAGFSPNEVIYMRDL
jgi:hypothetical protein